MSENSQETFDKLTELLEAFDACEPGSDEERKAWANYIAALEEANKQAGYNGDIDGLERPREN